MAKIKITIQPSAAQATALIKVLQDAPKQSATVVKLTELVEASVAAYQEAINAPAE
jgi:hypothetical protein